MTRSARTQLTRAVATVAVLGIAVGSVAEYLHHRSQKQAAAQPVTVARTPVASTPAPPAVIPHAGTPPTLMAATPTGTVPVVDTPPPVAASAAKVLAEAKLKAGANDWLAARKLLNDALVAGGLSDADAAAVKQQLTEVEAKTLFSGHAYAGDPLTGTVKVAQGDHLGTIAKQHAVPPELLMQLNGLKDPKRMRAGQSLKVVNGPFFAVVSKSRFTLDLYLGGPGGPGSTFVAAYPVGLGQDSSTPTGLWQVKNKSANPTYYPHGENPIAYGDPRNPLGPYWMALDGIEGAAVGAQSYGIHGTTDDSSIGKMASAGCVRMHNADVAVIFQRLVEDKSKVRIVD